MSTTRSPRRLRASGRSTGGRVAVVLPYGSRVATSRINFRLLARDALTHEKRLSIIASDSATRALAASAGLPVFASVQEYESSLPPSREVPADPTVADPPASAAAVRNAKRAAAAAAAAGAGAVAAGSGAAGAADATSPGTDTARVETPMESGADATDIATGSAIASGPPSRPGSAPPVPQDEGAAPESVRRPTVSVTGSSGNGRRTPLIVGLAVLGLALARRDRGCVSVPAVRQHHGHAQDRDARSGPTHGRRRSSDDRAGCRGRHGAGRDPDGRCERQRQLPRDGQAGRRDGGEGHRAVPECRLHLGEHDPRRQHRQRRRRDPVPHQPVRHRRCGDARRAADRAQVRVRRRHRRGARAGGQRRAEHDPHHPAGREPRHAVGHQPRGDHRRHARGIPEGDPGRRGQGDGRPRSRPPGVVRRAGRRPGAGLRRRHGLPRDGQPRRVHADGRSRQPRRNGSRDLRPGPQRDRHRHGGRQRAGLVDRRSQAARERGQPGRSSSRTRSRSTSGMRSSRVASSASRSRPAPPRSPSWTRTRSRPWCSARPRPRRP